eukprot:6030344-Prymnesium_polylepis.1
MHELHLLTISSEDSNVSWHTATLMGVMMHLTGWHWCVQREAAPMPIWKRRPELLESGST